MKSNASIRRIDDMGRVVIPNEICRNLKLKENDRMEVFVDNEGNIIIRKYKESWEETVLKWWRKHSFLPPLKRAEFYRMGDYTFCVIRNVDGSTIAGFAKRYCKDTDNDIIGKVAAFARALGTPINELIGWKG